MSFFRFPWFVPCEWCVYVSTCLALWHLENCPLNKMKYLHCNMLIREIRPKVTGSRLAFSKVMKS